ncbi:MAG TPA: autotransporter-associated beta strand repeat-containing protein [Pirellulales bacterium]|nr:autotransporter-associated beta strand repeat-containing protein [Pirellulales bacterium]
MSFTNNTGAVIDSLTLNWNYEQWRYANTSGWDLSGTGDLAGNATLNSKDFAGTGSGSGTNGTVTITSVPSFTLTGLSIANGDTFGLSWATTDQSSSDNGVSIDDFSLAFTNPGTVNTYFWIGNDNILGGDGTWDASTNSSWSADNMTIAATTWGSTKTARFSGATAGNVTINGTVNAAAGLYFTTDGYHLIPGTSAKIVLTGANAAANSINVDPAVTATIGTVVDGSAGMTKSGSGTLILTANNTYTGGTVISLGTLQIGNGGMSGSIVGNVTNGGTLVFNRSDNVTYAGTITGGTLTQNGVNSNSTLILTGNSAPSTTNITAGTVQIGDGTTPNAGSLAGNVNVSGGATLAYNLPSGSSDLTVAGAIAGPGNIVQMGGGKVIFTGALGTNTTSVNLTINPSTTVQIGDGTTTGTELFGPVLNNGALIYNKPESFTQSDAITGSGSVTKMASGTLTVTGNFNYGGGTTISQGTLQVGDGTATGSLAGDVMDSGVLAFKRPDPVNFTGNISGGGAVTHSGTGALTLNPTVSNSYTGGTNVTGGGILRAAANSSFGSSTGVPVNITKGTVLANAGVNIGNTITINSMATPSTVMADWTFETSAPTTAGPFVAESGTNAGSSNASGSHADSGVMYSSPSGNGSVHSYSSTNWGVGDYYQFTTSTTGQNGIVLSFDQTSSNTGPRDFQVEYSTNGSTFSNAGSAYMVGNSGWSNGSATTSSTTVLDLSSIEALNNVGTVYFRLVDTDTTSANGGTVGTSGTDRVDNVIIGSAGSGSSTAALGSDAGTGTTTYSGNIILNGPVVLTAGSGGKVSFTGAISGTGSSTVIKSGGGTVELNNQSFYSSSTVVQQGKLSLGVSNAISGTQAVKLDGGTLATEGLEQDFTTTTLSVLSNSTLDLSAVGPMMSPTNVKFGDSHIDPNTLSPAIWGGMLQVSGWTYGMDHLFVGSDHSGLNANELSDIQFADFAPGASISSTGEVTPLIGDINQDSHTDAADVAALLKALTNITKYQNDHSFSSADVSFILDVNGDGKVNSADLQALLHDLSSGGGNLSKAVPEPATWVLGMLGALGLALRRRRAGTA